MQHREQAGSDYRDRETEGGGTVVDVVKKVGADGVRKGRCRVVFTSRWCMALSCASAADSHTRQVSTETESTSKVKSD